MQIESSAQQFYYLFSGHFGSILILKWENVFFIRKKCALNVRLSHLFCDERVKGRTSANDYDNRVTQ